MECLLPELATFHSYKSRVFLFNSMLHLLLVFLFILVDAIVHLYITFFFVVFFFFCHECIIISIKRKGKKKKENKRICDFSEMVQLLKGESVGCLGGSFAFSHALTTSFWIISSLGDLVNTLYTKLYQPIFRSKFNL